MGHGRAACHGRRREIATQAPRPTAPGVTFLAPPKLGEEVTRFVRDSIMSGEYAPGERIRLEELADRLNVSTMPAREALTALVSEGLLEGLPRRGYRVVAMPKQDVEDIFRVHAFVGGLLAERAARSIGDEKVAELALLQQQAEKVVKQRLSKQERASQIEELNYNFHRIINTVPDAPRLRWFLRATTRYVPRHFYEAIPAWTDATVAEHPEIVEALRTRNGEAAKRLVEEHIEKAGRMVVDYLQAKGFWQALPAPATDGQVK